MVGSATQVSVGARNVHNVDHFITSGPALGPGDAEALFIGELDAM